MDSPSKSDEVAFTDLKTAYNDGDLELVRQLYDKKITIDIHKWLMEHACTDDHLDILKHMFDYISVGLNSSLDVIKYVVENYTSDIEYMLVLACENGHLEILKYLIDIKELTIEDLRRDYKWLLKIAYSSEHSNVISYLFGDDSPRVCKYFDV